MAMEFAGDENTNEKTRFRFHCDDTDCQGNKYFYCHHAMDARPTSGCP